MKYSLGRFIQYKKILLKGRKLHYLEIFHHKLPWWTKIILSTIVSRIPKQYLLFRPFGFKHGDMMNPKYSINVFLKNFNKVKRFLSNDYNILELGPGDSISIAIIGYAFGASKIFLVDVDDSASKSMNIYYKLIEELIKFKTVKNVSSLLEAKNVNEILKLTNAQYYINGLHSLKEIPSETIDFIFSNAVLEHIHLMSLKIFYMSYIEYHQKNLLCLIQLI